MNYAIELEMDLNDKLKNDIDNLKEQLEDKDIEIERLNNIINELEKYVDNLWLDDKGIVLRFREKLQILKGGSSNGNNGNI